MENPELDHVTRPVSGRINSRVHDTTPGGESPFSPPAGWNGDRKAYKEMMRERYKSVLYAQRMILAARFAKEGNHLPLEVTGPYREEAMEIIQALSR